MKHFAILVILSFFASIAFANCPPASSITISESNQVIPPPGYTYIPPPDGTIDAKDSISPLQVILVTNSDGNNKQDITVNQENCFYMANNKSSYPQGVSFTITKNKVPYQSSIGKGNWHYEDNGIFLCNMNNVAECSFSN
ncbi:MAG TPA: hypothetical protein VHM20_05000 [Gammaproteobacteria bacterium]|nr:hypothetical protein [Gammaproteobacteria bacterium]